MCLVISISVYSIILMDLMVYRVWMVCLVISLYVYSLDGFDGVRGLDGV